MADSVLRHATDRKLARLASQQEHFEQHRSSLLGARQTSSDGLEYVRNLLEGVKKWGLDKGAHLSADNMGLFLKQAHHDASIPAKTLLRWQQILEGTLEIQSERYRYASLFGKLVTEWINNPNEAISILDRADNSDSKLESTDFDAMDFEPVGRKEMHEQRATWESLVFTERKVDQGALLSYLSDLFGKASESKNASRTPIETLQECMAGFEVIPFDTDNLRTTIKACLRSDIFAGKKRQALLDLKDQPAVLEEMTDVLNMDLNALDVWTWEPSPIVVTQRRQVNGKYRFFMDEEIHQALLLQYIGSSFAVFLKSCLDTFFRNSKWDRGLKKSAMSSMDAKRRTFFLQSGASISGRQLRTISDSTNADCVKDYRRRQYNDNFFLLMLPDELEEGARDYSGESDDKRKTPVDSKHDLLHFLTTDILYSLEVHKGLSVLQSDFKWFGPGLPHSTIMTVLKFFGVPDHLLGFFQSFLATPMIFSQDGPGAMPQIRRRGVPMSHALSDAFGEAILFCLDVAVNKATEGENLIRLHDDLWFWGTSAACETAWATIQRFSDVTGLELNMDKTASIQLSHPSASLVPKNSRLPEGEIRWGFLRLDAETRRWVIAADEVDAHIKELDLQLSACRSVFAWVQAWNTYVSRFFTTNFGKAANCFGTSHLNDVIATFEHIQKSLFPSGSVTAHLKEMIQKRFGVDDIPEGFFYLPIQLGGLDLRNPFIPLLSLRESFARRDAIPDPLIELAIAFEREKEQYAAAKDKFDRAHYHLPVEGDFRPEDADTFFSFDEYVAFRDETSEPLYKAFEYLQQTPLDVYVDSTPELDQAVRGPLKDVLGTDWVGSTYNKWIVALYGPEISERFGGLSIGDKELLPIGLVNVMRSEKVRWQG